MTTLKIILILALGFAPLPLLAAGLEVSPSELTIYRSKAGQTEMKVSNPTTESLDFRIYPDRHRESLKITPENFRLAPGQNRTIKVAATSSKNFQTNLSVVASPHDANAFQAAAGTKIPLSIKDNKPTDWVVWLIYGLMFFGSLFLLSLLPKQKLRG